MESSNKQRQHRYFERCVDQLNSQHKATEIRGKFLAIGMTASKAIAVMADSEDIASNSCHRILTVSLPVFCWSVSGVRRGRRIRHTSASLLIQENYDDSARVDLENWLNRLVPENDLLYTHTLEGPDDMPAHIKCALTAIQISVPFQAGELLLGTWQGIYLWEHRHQAGAREVIVHLA